MAEPLKAEEPTMNARAFARQYMERHDQDVHAAADAMLAALEDAETWNALGEEVVLAGLRHLARCVRSEDRSEGLGRAKGECSSPGLVEQGEALLRAYGMADPFSWPVPYIGKALGDSTPEDLLEAAEECSAQSEILSDRAALCTRLAEAGEPGVVLRETLTVEECSRLLGG